MIGAAVAAPDGRMRTLVAESEQDRAAGDQERAEDLAAVRRLADRPAERGGEEDRGVAQRQDQAGAALPQRDDEQEERGGTERPGAEVAERSGADQAPDVAEARPQRPEVDRG